LKVIILTVLTIFLNIGNITAGPLKAGVAKINITDTESSEFVSDSLYVKALVLDNGSVKAVIVTVDMEKLNEINMSNMNKYLNNIYAMDILSRNQTNISLLRKHKKINREAGEKTIDVEIHGIRIGKF